jgi:hypothetical protein
MRNHLLPVPVDCEASVIWTGQAKAECFSIIKLLHTLFIVFTPSTVALAIVSDRHFNCIFTPYKAARAVFACPQHVRTDTCCFRGCLPASCACLLCFQKKFSSLHRQFWYLVYMFKLQHPMHEIWGFESVGARAAGKRTCSRLRLVY